MAIRWRDGRKEVSPSIRKSSRNLATKEPSEARGSKANESELPYENFDRWFGPTEGSMRTVGQKGKSAEPKQSELSPPRSKGRA